MRAEELDELRGRAVRGLSGAARAWQAAKRAAGEDPGVVSRAPDEEPADPASLTRIPPVEP